MVAFIACCKLKNSKTTVAEKMYVSTLFKFSLAYAKEKADHIFILSAKYGLLALSDKIDPYNETLNTKTDEEIKGWSKKIYKDILKLGLNKEEFLYLCGDKYKKYLIEKLPGKDPMKGLGLGYRLQWLKKHTHSTYNILED